LIKELKLMKHYKWIFNLEEEEGKQSSRRDKILQVMEDYNQGNYVAPPTTAQSDYDPGMPTVIPSTIV
jgi:hypothetical protein